MTGRHITRHVRLAGAIAVVFTALALGAGSAFAGVGQSPLVAGEYEVHGLGTTDCVALDAVRLQCSTSGLESRYEGSLDGYSTASFEQVIDCATGKTHGHGTESFDGTVRGRPGSLTWRLVFTSDFDCATFFPSNLRIVAAITGSSGGLAPLHGVLLFDDDSYRGVLG